MIALHALLGGVLVLEVVRGVRPSNLQREEKVGSRGNEGDGVGSLYTFGCPHVSAPALTNPARDDGCFPGYRIVNQESNSITHAMDLVTMLLNPTSYKHVRQATVKLIAKDALSLKLQPPQVHECGWEEDELFTPSLQEHMYQDYAKRAEIVSDDAVPNLSKVANLTLYNSYNKIIAEVARNVESQKWGLVDSAVIGSGVAVIGKEPSHLMQDPISLRCLLTFEGSDDAKDFILDATVNQVSFCGLAQKVHSGFKSVVLEMVSSEEFQEKIRPQLPFCSKVDIMGHSLGGGTASLFAACASNPLQPGAAGYEDYQHFGWTPDEPKKLEYM